MKQDLWVEHLAFQHRQWIRILLRVIGILVILHMTSLVTGRHSWQLDRFFDLGRDDSLPAWFSSMLWLACSVAAYRCSNLSRDAYEKKVWFWFAVGLLIFSIDETARIHENLSHLVERRFFDPAFAEKVRRTNWPIVAAPFIAAAFFWLFAFFKKVVRNHPRVWRGVSMGFLIVVLGGAGLEMTINWLQSDSLQWLFEMEVVAEESLEMLGCLLMLSAILEHVRTLIGEYSSRRPEGSESRRLPAWV